MYHIGCVVVSPKHLDVIINHHITHTILINGNEHMYFCFKLYMSDYILFLGHICWIFLFLSYVHWLVLENYTTDDGVVLCIWCCLHLLLVYDICSSFHFLPRNNNTHATWRGSAKRKWNPLWNATHGPGMYYNYNTIMFNVLITRLCPQYGYTSNLAFIFAGI